MSIKIQESFFTKNLSNNKYDPNPIILLDSSGSTSSIFASTSKSIFKSYINILKKILKPEQFSCLVCQWSNSFTKTGFIDLNTNDFSNIKQHERGGTNLDCALNFGDEITNLNDKKNYIEIYIFTDGNCSGGEIFSSGLKKISDKYGSKLSFNIVTLTNCHTDYKKENYIYGNQIHQIILSNNLSKIIKKFLSFNNKYWNEPYMNISNPDYHDGYIPYLDNYFLITDLNKFIQYIDLQIKFNQTDSDELLKISHNLIPTILHLSKNKSLKIQTDIINMFVDLFEEMDIFADVGDMLKKEIINYNSNKITSYQDYRNNRNKLFENAQLSLLDDVKKTTSSILQEYYVSFIVDNKIILCTDEQIQEEFQVYNNKYKFGCSNINGYKIPILPTKTKSSIDTEQKSMNKHHFSNQCVRQWIRTIYSVRYGTYSSDDFILYMFLTDFVKIILSPNIPEQVKQYYRNLAYVILDRNRYQSGGKQEINFLLEGNHPQPNIGSIEMIYEILSKCIEESELFNFLQFKPMVLWWFIVISLGNEKLIQVQWDYCKKDVNEYFKEFYSTNNFNPSPMNFLDLIKNKIEHYKFIEFYDYSILNKPKLDFYDFVILDDNIENKGYQINKHTIYGEKMCTSKYVICKSTWDELEKCQVNCPICQKLLSQENFTWIDMEIDVNKKINDDEIQDNHWSNKIKINDLICLGNIKNIENIELSLKENPKIIKFDDLDFDAGIRYNIGSKIYLQNIMIKYNFTKIRKSDEFNNLIKKEYSFLNNINWNNLLLAGGFCRSILLNQQVSDLDFFIYGLTSDLDRQKKFCDLRNDLIESIRHELIIKKNLKNLCLFELYKKNNSVYEIIVIKLSNDIKKKINMNELSLQELEENIKNYNVLYKIQIVLSINDSIEDIFDKFDIEASCVGWNGKELLFNENSYMSYKYMINIWNPKKYDQIYYNTRIIKYYNYGFKIGFDNLETDVKSKTNNNLIDKIKELTNLQIEIVEQQKNCLNINKIYRTNTKFTNNGLYSDISNMDFGNKVLENTIKYIKICNTDEKNIYYIFNEINNSELIKNLAYDDIIFVDNIFFEMKKKNITNKIYNVNESDESDESDELDKSNTGKDIKKHMKKNNEKDKKIIKYEPDEDEYNSDEDNSDEDNSDKSYNSDEEYIEDIKKHIKKNNEKDKKYILKKELENIINDKIL